MAARWKNRPRFVFLTSSSKSFNYLPPIDSASQWNITRKAEVWDLTKYAQTVSPGARSEVT
jgi:hypothetical protein